MVNKIRTSKFVEAGSRILALLAVTFVVVVGSIAAREHQPKRSGAESQAVATACGDSEHYR
jgi:hypothetical protein